MNNENQVDSTQMDDINYDGPSEQELLDAVIRGSELAQAAGVAPDDIPLPDEEEIVEDPVDEDIPDPDDEEAVSEDDEEEIVDEEVETEGADDENSTQEPDVYTADDLDLDAQVTVKVDGEEMNVSFADLIKGYQTDAHLSKKGRELSEAQAEIEEYRTARLGEIEQMGEGVAAMLGQQEQYFAKQYHDIEAKIEKARKDGDTYEVNELKDKREQAQKGYHDAKQRREGMLGAIAQQKQQKEQEEWNAQLEYFNQEIPNLIPDFNEDTAQSIRQFAIDEGIDPTVLDQITDPVIVKFVDDYRRLKQGVSKGAAKRKAVPAKKSVPSKKGKTTQKKKQDKEAMVKARAFREDASEADQMDFLRQMASKSLNL